MSEKIIVKRNPNGDTRTALKGVTFEQFQKANRLHCEDVLEIMRVLAEELYTNGIVHDWTKKKHEQKFYDDFTKVLNEGGDFTKMEWYQLHIHEEKHHPTSYLHPDYNLLDLIETIVDCVVAGVSRSGEVRPLEIDDNIVKLAIKNTVDLIKNMIEVEE